MLCLSDFSIDSVHRGVAITLDAALLCCNRCIKVQRRGYAQNRRMVNYCRAGITKVKIPINAGGWWGRRLPADHYFIMSYVIRSACVAESEFIAMARTVDATFG